LQLFGINLCIYHTLCKAVCSERRFSEKSTFIFFPLRNSAVPMGSFNLAFERSQGQSRYYLYSGQPSSRCAVEYRSTAWQCSACVYAPTKTVSTALVDSLPILGNDFPQPPSAPFDFYPFVFPRTKRFPFLSKGKKNRHPELRGPDPNKSEA